MTEQEALRISKAIDETIENSKSLSDFIRNLEWLKNNVIGSVNH